MLFINHQHHLKFAALSVDLNIIPNGLHINKSQCVQISDDEYKAEWNRIS